MLYRKGGEAGFFVLTVWTFNDLVFYNCYGGTVIHTIRTKLIYFVICLMGVGAVVFPKASLGIFGRENLPDKKSLVSFDEKVAVWVSMDGTKLCMQTAEYAPAYCKSIGELGLPADFFLMDGRAGELTGALTVHNSYDKSWIYLGSKGALYQLHYTKKLLTEPWPHHAPSYSQKGVTKISEELVWVTHLRAYEKMYDIDSGEGAHNTSSEFNVIVCVEEPGSTDDNDGMIAFYRVDVNTSSINEVNPVGYLLYRKNLKTSDPLRGVEMTSIGLFIATSKMLYFYRRTKAHGLQLERSTEISPTDFILDDERKLSFQEIRAIDYTANAVGTRKGYLTVATDVGTFISNLDTNMWTDISVRRGGVGADMINPVVSYARLETEPGPVKNIYFSACEDVFKTGRWKPGGVEKGEISEFNQSSGVEWPCMKSEHWEKEEHSTSDDLVVGTMDSDDLEEVSPAPLMRNEEMSQLSYLTVDHPYPKFHVSRSDPEKLRSFERKKAVIVLGEGSCRRGNASILPPQINLDGNVGASTTAMTFPSAFTQVPQLYEQHQQYTVLPLAIPIPVSFKNPNTHYIATEHLSRSDPTGRELFGFGNPQQYYLSDPIAGIWPYHGMTFDSKGL
ncbi:hypothetical protein [Sansalvadorimonas verongulae]|uniref:hypothetical protein n=1 Tax=Sansalvadorimonas verongulae TaxID=2172824 RepID=UPI0012BD20E5|nr:hypothetical protein [Sansalvadorimonas verongulae]MTI15451.1 hypothetical protein [Sansalvadorimonas verongulae]